MIASSARRLLPLLAMVGTLAPWASPHAAAQDPSRLTVLFTGDCGGKTAPCG